MVKKIILILTIILISCNTEFVFKKNSRFNYKKENNSEINLYFFKDSTFKYYDEAGLATNYSRGKYKLQKNKLILKSDSIFKQGILKVTENQEKNSLYKSVNIVDNQGEPTYENIGITFNHIRKFYDTDLEGFLKIHPDSIIKRIEIFTVDSIYSYQLKNDLSNKIIIWYKRPELDLKYFNNDTLNIKKNKIKGLYNNIILNKTSWEKPKENDGYELN